MHELSIAVGMADEITRIAEENNAKKILAVNLKIGRRAGVVIDSLKFAIDIVKQGHPLLSFTKILIEESPLIYRCINCSNEFETDDIYFPACPECRSYNLKILSGEELDILNLEVEVQEEA